LFLQNYYLKYKKMNIKRKWVTQYEVLEMFFCIFGCVKNYIYLIFFRIHQRQMKKHINYV